jgi:nucleoside-diphosphate-sugar epimerase
MNKKENYTLVTGSNGFLGKKIVDELQSKKIKFLPTHNKKKNNIKSIQLNLKKLNIKKIKNYKIDKIIHLAWPNLDNFLDKSHQTQILKYQKNFIKKMIEHGCKNFIIAGTCYEYGLINGKINEKKKTNPVTSYGRGKDLLRKFIFKMKKKYNLKVTWLRIFYIYGLNDTRVTLTNLLINSKQKKQTIILNNRIQRDYVDINFVTKVFVQILLKNKGFGVVNLCSGKKIFLKDLVKTLRRKFKIKPLVKYQNTKQRKFEPESFYGCNYKLKKILKSAKQ